MLVGVPKEIKDNEYRVGIVPSTVRELTEKEHQVVSKPAREPGFRIISRSVLRAGLILRQPAGCARFGNNCGRSLGWQPIIFGA